MCPLMISGVAVRDKSTVTGTLELHGFPAVEAFPGAGIDGSPEVAFEFCGCWR